MYFLSIDLRKGKKEINRFEECDETKIDFSIIAKHKQVSTK